ncbi:hypothetical protein KY358_01435 [Candidatus Woesearchaeota archaeon]|nr:hypothetical protein [Candidatus Woesearchaeota archaeon]
MDNRGVSKTTIFSIVVLVIVAVLIFSWMANFEENVKKTEQSSSVNVCRISGTTNYCCKPYSGNEITPKEGGWSDCDEPESACCVG